MVWPSLVFLLLHPSSSILHQRRADLRAGEGFDPLHHLHVIGFFAQSVISAPRMLMRANSPRLRTITRILLSR
jgi:hypothetical protein